LVFAVAAAHQFHGAQHAAASHWVGGRVRPRFSIVGFDIDEHPTLALPQPQGQGAGEGLRPTILQENLAHALQAAPSRLGVWIGPKQRSPDNDLVCSHQSTHLQQTWTSPVVQGLSSHWRLQVQQCTPIDARHRPIARHRRIGEEALYDLGEHWVVEWGHSPAQLSPGGFHDHRIAHPQTGRFDRLHPSGIPGGWPRLQKAKAILWVHQDIGESIPQQAIKISVFSFPFRSFRGDGTHHRRVTFHQCFGQLRPDCHCMIRQSWTLKDSASHR
jgi:hypothetical protein